MITSLLGLIIVGVVLGIIYWLVGAIPFIPPMFKQVLQWIVILFAALILIDFLLQLAGQSGVGIVRWRVR